MGPHSGGEIPHRTAALARFIDELVIGQIDDDNFDRLPDETTRTLLLVLIEAAALDRRACAAGKARAVRSI